MKTFGFLMTTIFILFGFLLLAGAICVDFVPPINLMLALAGLSMFVGATITVMLTYIIDELEK
jgi:hypothetical protein